LRPAVTTVAPRTAALFGAGPDVAGQLLATAGDNPHRLRSEAALAHLAGISPLPASSGRTDRHRLNRGGDRALNRAIHAIALTRMRSCPRTRAYIARRTAEGKTTREIRRCLIGRVWAGGPGWPVRRERRGTASMSRHWMACLSWSPLSLPGGVIGAREQPR
jgi:transposase